MEGPNFKIYFSVTENVTESLLAFSVCAFTQRHTWFSSLTMEILHSHMASPYGKCVPVVLPSVLEGSFHDGHLESAFSKLWWDHSRSFAVGEPTGLD